MTTACGTTADSAAGYYRLLPANLNDDLWGRCGTLNRILRWLPAQADLGSGQNLHHHGGKNPIQNLKVRFWEGVPGVGVQIGDGTIPLLSPGGTNRTHLRHQHQCSWLGAQQIGKYTIVHGHGSG